MERTKGNEVKVEPLALIEFELRDAYIGADGEIHFLPAPIVMLTREELQKRLQGR